MSDFHVAGGGNYIGSFYQDVCSLLIRAGNHNRCLIGEIQKMPGMHVLMVNQVMKSFNII